MWELFSEHDLFQLTWSLPVLSFSSENNSFVFHKWAKVHFEYRPHFLIYQFSCWQAPRLSPEFSNKNGVPETSVQKKLQSQNCRIFSLNCYEWITWTLCFHTRNLCIISILLEHLYLPCKNKASSYPIVLQCSHYYLVICILVWNHSSGLHLSDR